jgi:glycosyltransferase involved in cell wall biosynthesis
LKEGGVNMSSFPYSPAISVVIPLYNHARYIDVALDSVLAQTSPADEIVLIDDGSSDDGIARAECVFKSSPNARVYRQTNQGAHATLNTLVRISRSEYVAILNSDDMFMPDKLARCREIFVQQPATGLICGAISLFNQNGEDIIEGEEVNWLGRAQAFRNESGLLQLSLLNENWVATTSNMVFSRTLWMGVNGFHALRYCHDIDFLMAAFSRTNIVFDDAHTHIRYRVHPSNTIKENIFDVRLELASVISATLCTSGHYLFGGDADGATIASYRKFLQNKNCGALISLLQTLYAGFPNRAQFYEFVLAPSRREALIELLLS